jgi:DNA-binding SARP family transcriptional activator
MGALTITTFGEPHLLHDQQPCRFPFRKVLALALYLAVTGQAQTRAHLIALLWPNADEVRGQQNLRQALHRLRKALAPDADAHLVANSENVRLSLGQEGSIDVQQLHSATLTDAPPARRLAAFHLYKGDFLADLILDDAPDFMEWVTAQRTYWETAYDLLAERVMMDLIDTGHADEACVLGQTWVTHRPDAEAAYRFLATAQATISDVSGARLTLARAERRFAELEFSLSSETNILRERLSTFAPVPVPKQVLRLPFVGRRETFLHMRQAYHNIVGGTAAMVLVQGEAGMGKSRLVEAFLQWGKVQGADVALGHAYELSGRLPYQPLMELLQQRLAHEHALDDVFEDGWLIELQRLVPDIHHRYPDLPLPIDDPAAGTRLIEAIAQVGITLGRHHPVLWLIEDLHWADEATRDGLLYLLARWRAEAIPAMIVGTLRREEIATSPALVAWMASVQRTMAVTEVQLTALSAEQTTQAVTALLGESVDPALYVWFYEETQGNPLYLQHVMQALVERGIVAWQGDALQFMAGVDANTFVGWLPESLRGLLLRRVQRLDPVTQRVLAAATVVGARFREDLLMQVAGVAEDTLLTALESAEWCLLISANAGQYGFTHDKVAQALYSDLSVARRRAFHRRALHALIAEGHAPAADLLRHALGSEAWEDAIRYGQQAAEAANQMGAHLDALRFYEQIVSLLTTSPSKDVLQTIITDEMLVAHYTVLAYAYLNLGKTAQALALYQALLMEARATNARYLEGEILVRLARIVLAYEHDPMAAQELLRTAAPLLEETGDIAGQITAKTILADALLAQEALPQAKASILQGILLARGHGLATTAAEGLNTLFEVAAWEGEWEAASAAAEESILLLALSQEGKPAPESSAPYRFQTLFAWSSYFPQIAGLLEIEPTRANNRARQWGADGLAKMSAARLHLGDGNTGRAALEMAWRIFTERNEQRFYVYYLLHRVLGWLEMGAYERAWHETQQIIEGRNAATDRLSDPSRVELPCAVIDVAHVLFLLDAAPAPLEQADLFAAEKQSWHRLMVATRWCTQHALRGDWEAAHHATLHAQAIRDVTATQRNAFDLARYFETEALLRAGDRDRASADAQRFHAQLGTNRRYRLIWLRMQALLDRDAQDHPAAIAHLTEAATLAAEMGLPGEQWQVARELAASFQQAGDAHQASEWQATAEVIIEQLAMRITDPDLRAHFAQAAHSRSPALSA